MPADPKGATPVKWTSWILLGVALGGPLAGLGAFKDWAVQNPWLAAALTLAWSVAAFAFSLVQGVWKRLESRWLDQAAQWVDFQFQCVVLGYRRKYLKHLTAECYEIDVKGLTTQGVYALSLQRVFGELEGIPPPRTKLPPKPHQDCLPSSPTVATTFGTTSPPEPTSR